MIDDYAKTMDLMHRIESQLPIPVSLSSRVVRMLREKGTVVSSDQSLEIRRVFYLGDEGGIMCDVPLLEDEKQAFVISITHLLIPAHHPLAPEIRAYQRQRAQRIIQSGELKEPSYLTVHPRKRRGH